MVQTMAKLVEQRRDFVSVDDVVSVNLWFLDHPEVSGIFNVGTGRAQTFNDVAAAVINSCRQQAGEPALGLGRGGVDLGADVGEQLALIQGREGVKALLTGLKPGLAVLAASRVGVDGAALGISVTNFNEGGRLAVVQGNLIRNLKTKRPAGTAIG